MSSIESTIELAHRFINSVRAGDEAGARDCMHADAGIWHNYDNKTQSVDENMATMQLMIDKTSKRAYQIHRIDLVEGGYLQRHTLTLTALDGGETACTEALALVTVEGGKIKYVEEFIDPTPILSMLRA